MTQVAAVSILALTISLSLSRPRVWHFQIHHSTAAVIGALLCVISGLVPPPLVLRAFQFLLFPVITIVSLMAITLIAERAGLFEFVAHGIAKAANGNAKKLFAYLFFSGTLTGAVFTNDAAVLIFTPLVFNLIEEVQDESWSAANKIPFYFSVLYIANLVGVLVISNPINITVSKFFGISFLDYAKWMALPAIVSIVTTYFGLKLFFKGTIPETFKPLEAPARSAKDRKFMVICGIVLSLTLIGFFSESLTGVPTWLVALSGALVLLLLCALKAPTAPAQIIKGIGWDVIVFVVGIFIVAYGLRNVGLTAQMGSFITALSPGHGLASLTNTTGFTAAVCSSIMNNHPTSYTMAMVIHDMHLPAFETKIAAFAALIGGDLGPKMLPIGSLAALLWFRILRDRGVYISYSLYIKIGIPVTLAAILLSILVLNLEVFLSRLY